MKKFILILLVFIAQKTFAQNPENWTSKQLLEPSQLATTLKSGKNVPTIFCVGPGAVIPRSVDIGMVKDEANMQKFKEALSKLPRNTNIVVYCGCCPFEHCPDVRPAIQALKDLNFTNYKLLDLPHNIKTDWISKGFPTNSE